MKTAVSIPDDVFEKAEQTAKRLGISRSELFARALREFLEGVDTRRLKESYDRAFADDDEADHRFQREAARRALLDVEW